MLQEEQKCANTEFDWDVKRGIENSVCKKSCPLMRVSISGELTVIGSQDNFKIKRVLGHSKKTFQFKTSKSAKPIPYF